MQNYMMHAQHLYKQSRPVTNNKLAIGRQRIERQINGTKTPSF
jgi:hypothetical protein